MMIHPSPGAMKTRRQRIMISGLPGTRKTTSLLTFPRPIGIVSFPGEKGYDTIPLDDPTIIPFVYQADSATVVNSDKILAEVDRTMVDLIAGKHGSIQTLAGDGLHKFVDYVLDSVTGGAYFGGEEFEPKLYRRAYDAFTSYLDRWCQTMIPVVVFTCWAEYEADRIRKPGEKQSDIPSYIYPALPGKLAKSILGEFSVVVHQTLRKGAPTDQEVSGYWQTRPAGEVKGCTIKGPVEIVKRIPTFIKADYQELTRYWAEEAPS